MKLRDKLPPIITEKLPQKVFIERDGCSWEHSYERPDVFNFGEDRLHDLLHGYYGCQNMITLFNTVPEVFAPVNEIASRVANAKWLLKKSTNDSTVWNDEAFNRLFSAPNPLQSFQKFVWESVVYEILNGLQVFYMNIPSALNTDQKDPDNVLSWFNLPTQNLKAIVNNIDPYTITELSDIIQRWELTINHLQRSAKKTFEVEKTLPILHGSLDGIEDINNPRSLLLGAEKAIKNLIPVYEARGMIYIKRGAMGLLVSAKTDGSGSVALTPKEKDSVRAEYQRTYGILGNKSPMAITDQPLSYIQTGLSIKDLEPFTETLADAMAIYAVLRVPRHLAPNKDNSTFNNANSDVKNFYNATIIPWAQKYADIWTAGLGFDQRNRYIQADFSHIDELKENAKDKATTDKIIGDTWLVRWKSGVCSLNDWIRAFDGAPVTDNDLYDKKYFELTDEEKQLLNGNFNASADTTTVDPAQEADSARD